MATLVGSGMAEDWCRIDDAVVMRRCLGRLRSTKRLRGIKDDMVFCVGRVNGMFIGFLWVND